MTKWEKLLSWLWEAAMARKPVVTGVKWFVRTESGSLSGPYVTRFADYPDPMVWSERIPRLKMCENGWHFYPTVDAARLRKPLAFGGRKMELWIIEARSAKTYGHNTFLRNVGHSDFRLTGKMVASQIRLIRKVGKSDVIHPRRRR